MFIYYCLACETGVCDNIWLVCILWNGIKSFFANFVLAFRVGQFSKKSPHKTGNHQQASRACETVFQITDSLLLAKDYEYALPQALNVLLDYKVCVTEHKASEVSMI